MAGPRISRMLALPYIATIEQTPAARPGRRHLGTHQSEFHVELKPAPLWTRVKPRMPCARSWLAIPAFRPSGDLLGDRISESLTGETADIAIKVFGDKLTLDTVGRRITLRWAARRHHRPAFKVQSGTPTLP